MFGLSAIVFIVAAVFSYRYWLNHTTKNGAPFVALDMEIVERMLELARVKEGDVVYDLGSGDGRIPIFASLKYNTKAVGIELDPIRFYYCKALAFIHRLGGKTIFLQKNIFDVDLSEASVVTMYLLQKTNERLMKKLETELQPGTRIVSAAFNFPGWKPLFVDREYITPYGPLYLYQMGISNAKKPF